MRIILILVGVAVLISTAFWYVNSASDGESAGMPDSFTDSEAGFDAEPDEEMALPIEYRIGGGQQYTLAELREWQRPAGSLRVGLQVGHLDNDQVPEELSGLTRNGAGATYGQFNERDTVEVITQLIAERLEAEGVVVDVLPATVPPGYVADAFISIHADGNPNTSVRGYKIAGPRRDYSGRSEALVSDLYASYGPATNLPEDPNVSRRMTAYYAFNWARYEYAVHPFTPVAIVETGFLTNANDRNLLVNQPALSARGISEGILAYLADIPEPTPPPQTLSAPTLPVSGTLECAPVRADRRDRGDSRGCLPSVQVGSTHYALMSEAEIATTTFPFSGTVQGNYVPIQTLDNYFWFHWEVSGIIDEAEITPTI